MKSAAVVFALLGLAACDIPAITMDDWMKMNLGELIDHIPSCYITCGKVNYDSYCKGTDYDGLDCFCSSKSPLPTGKDVDAAAEQCEQANCRPDILDRADKDMSHFSTACQRVEKGESAVDISELAMAKTRIIHRFEVADLPKGVSAPASSPSVSKTSAGSKPSESAGGSNDKKSDAAGHDARAISAIVIAAAAVAAF
ncbi:hypothetical protein NLG97_g5930 [Lecanicillium saksenae]|uniref:Uncharacterized protein n=1 Tax=Lecanicillium saksenae TaxID=468837 RepID=A0ACC1QUX1_9HYPO|nr:hypothetical protein NLG97_g5930 [Lecanicillium saksenae]